VAPRIDDELAAVRDDVLERDPRAAHVPRRKRGQVNRVLVRVLLAAENVGKRLARPGWSGEDQIGHAQVPAVEPQASHRRVLLVQSFETLARPVLVSLPALRNRIVDLAIDRVEEFIVEKPFQNDVAALDEMPKLMGVLVRELARSGTAG